MSTERNYRIRYFVEPWDKPPEHKAEPTDVPGISKTHSDYGYTDDLLVVSILRNEKGEAISFLVADTLDKGEHFTNSEKSHMAQALLKHFTE